MTEEARISLKNLNKKYFDDHIDEIIWSDEKRRLTVRMNTNEKFEFLGDTAKDMYKNLVKGNMQ